MWQHILSTHMFMPLWENIMFLQVQVEIYCFRSDAINLVEHIHTYSTRHCTHLRDSHKYEYNQITLGP
jgi:hypothetical protein